MTFHAETRRTITSTLLRAPTKQDHRD
jgi:hypothetical protein